MLSQPIKAMCFIARASEFSRGKRTASYHIVITKKGTQDKIALFEGLV
jgi:hypothetical protein